jgi:PTH1 family peptidyl-tRNA hydrolase
MRFFRRRSANSSLITHHSPRLIVGLGNPGKDYEGTRHNVGYMAIDILAKRHHIFVKARRNRARVGEGTISDEKMILAKPLTFMNLSGEAVSGLIRRYRLNLEDVIVICDDVNLPVGRLRIRASGSAGGHKGLKSIIHCLGTEDFPRVRIGIGAPDRGMVDYVLSRFTREERPVIKQAVNRAADAVEAILASGIEQAMNEFNAPPAAP